MKNIIEFKLATMAAFCWAGMPFTQAGTIQLASTMDGDSYFSEGTPTVGIFSGFSQINLGDGSFGSTGAFTGDADGIYAVGDRGQPSPSLLGTEVDIFPREADFLIGNLSFDGTGLANDFTGTVSITAIDLGEFWKDDPERTNSDAATSRPSVISDISDHGLGLAFFNGDGSINFGALDASDTITFTNGILTSIDLEITTSFFADAFGSPATWNGTFSIVGSNISYQIDETLLVGGFQESRLVWDLTGDVNSVGTYAIPEPGSFAAIAGLLGFALAALRRRGARS